MKTIESFVAEFSQDRAQYIEIEKQLGVSCKTALPTVQFLWQSRVKDSTSLRKKLRDRQDRYKDERDNVDDIKDLVGGRIIFLHWSDLPHIESVIETHFIVKWRSKHPKSAMETEARFRSYSAIHFHVTRQSTSDERYRNLTIEIQVMSHPMWFFSALEQDIIYKQKHGPPDGKLVALIEMLKGNANQDEILSQQIEELQIEERARPGFEKIVSQRHNPGFDSSPAMVDLAAEVAGTVVRLDSDKLEKAIQELGSRMKNCHQTEEESKCLQALYQSDYKTSKERNPDRVEGTYKWLLENRRFGSWLESESSDLLWVTADPGCGKSVLSNSLINHELQSSPSSITAYFFFKDDNEDQRRVAKAISSLIHQILHQSGSRLIGTAIKFYQDYGSRLAESFSLLWDLLLELSKDSKAGRIFCILDALDECETSERNLLIRSLNTHYATSRLSKSSGDTSRLKFLVTSRPYLTIQNRFDSQTIRLSGEEESEIIKQEIDLVIEYRVPEVASRLELNSELQSLLRQRLLDANNRTYLWLHLILEDILDSTRVKTAQKLERFLNKLPSSIYQAYDHILRDSREPETARKLLHIILAAARPLTLREMNMALNIKKGQHSREEVDLDPEEDLVTSIRNICGLFVIVNRTDSKVYLLHQTAKEFLVSRENALRPESNSTSCHTWQHSMKTEDSHYVLAQICFNYLLFSTFETEPLQIIANAEDGPTVYDWERPLTTQRQIIAYTHKHDFLDYAAHHWHFHFQLARNDYKQTKFWYSVCDVNGATFDTWFGIYWQDVARAVGMNLPATHVKPTPLIVASMIGHTSIVQRLAVAQELESRDSDGHTALCWATKLDQIQVVKQLLELGAFADAKERNGRTPLHEAATFGHVVTMKTLIGHGASVDAADDLGRTPLHSAILSGPSDNSRLKSSLQMVRILLSNGADLHHRDNFGNTAMSTAMASPKDPGNAKLLIENGALHGLSDAEHSSLLEAALDSDHKETAELLTSQGIDFRKTCIGVRRALWRAVTDGRSDMVEILLKKLRADSNIRDERSKDTPLFRATSGPYVNHKVVQTLLNNGADPDLRYRSGLTALWHLERYPDREGENQLIMELLRAVTFAPPSPGVDDPYPNPGLELVAKPSSSSDLGQAYR